MILVGLAEKRWLPVTLLLGLTISPLPRGLETLHADRAGFRAAGLWLADHTAPGDVVIDPYCWASYYAGEVFKEGSEPNSGGAAGRSAYVVLERSPNEHSRLTTVAVAMNLAKSGEVVYRAQPQRRRSEQVEVLVYHVPIPTGH